MSTFLAVIMVMSGFGIYLSSSQSQGTKIKEDGLVFVFDQSQRIYTTKIDGKKMFFYNLPSEVKRIPSDDFAAAYLRDAEAVALSFDPNMSSTNLQAIDILRYDLSLDLGKVTISAVTQKSGMYPSFPLIDCRNATAQYPVVLFEESPVTSITTQGPCIMVQSNMSGFLEARDRLLYDYYDVYSDE